jgi:ribulose-phosphate 3-epimerase
MKISASLYSGKLEELIETAQELERYGVDYFHIDCNDDLNVFNDIRKVREASHVPIDLHIITDHPSKYYEELRDTEVEFVCFQYENLKEPLAVPDYIHSRLGLAIMTDTDISVFDEFADRFSFILFMTTTPGKSGGVFNEKNFEKIRAFRAKYPNKLIHADGGVNDEVAFILRSLGVNSAVCGSYLMKNDDRGKALLHLKTDIRDYNYKISDFMMKPSEFAVLEESKANLETILNEMTRYKQGFLLVVDAERKLKGVVTDYDIRENLIKHYNDLNQMKEIDLVNHNPKYILHSQSIEELMEVVRRTDRPLKFLPVINDERRLEGAVSFNSLVKGEI